MSATPSMLPPAQVVEEFRARRKRQFLAAVPAIVAIFLVLWLSDHPQSTPFGMNHNAILIGAGVLVLVYVIFSLKNWRCPSCERYLGKNMFPSFCAKCGVKLSS